MQHVRYVNIFAAAAFLVFGSACAKKKVAVSQPPAPPSAATTSDAPAPTSVAPQREPERPPVAQATPSRVPDAATKARIEELIGRIQDAYFDYNQHSLRNDAITTLNSNAKELAQILQQFPEYKLKIEGYCDERGSSEYNIALGDARAKAAKDYLVSVGVASDQLSTVSFGKENPVCTLHDESCWSKNRRIHIVAIAAK
jgi:peptidoglycan-associated lipoprotein